MKIRLFTYQTVEAYNKLQDFGYLRIESKDSKLCMFNDEAWKNTNIKEAYDFMVDRMNKKLHDKDESIVYPIWAWYKYKGKKRRVKELDKIYKGYVKIVFEIDTYDCLLSDYTVFEYYPVAGLYAAISSEERKNVVSTDKEAFYKSWDRMFDIKNENDYLYFKNKKKTIQATFWELSIDQIISAKEI